MSSNSNMFNSYTLSYHIVMLLTISKHMHRIDFYDCPISLHFLLLRQRNQSYPFINNLSCGFSLHCTCHRIPLNYFWNILSLIIQCCSKSICVILIHSILIKILYFFRAVNLNFSHIPSALEKWQKGWHYYG